MVKSNFSCKGCPDRHPGCHAKCEKYNREKAAHEAEKAEAAKKAAIQNGLTSYQIGVCRRNVARKGRGWNGKEARNVE